MIARSTTAVVRHRHGAAARLFVAVLATLLATSLLSACDGADNSGSPPTDAQVAGLLRVHSKAVTAHDRSTFLAGIDARSVADGFRSEQDAEFANLRQLPLRTWTYRLSAAVTADGPQSAARARYGPSARIVRVALRFALRGVDAAPTQKFLWWTIARVGGHLVVCSDTGLADAGGVSWRGPWDFGPMTTVHGRHSLVVGEADQTPLLRDIATVADAAVPTVTAVWGDGWTQDVFVVVPPTAAALAADVSTAMTGLSANAGGATAGASGGSDGSDDVAFAVTDGMDPLTGSVLGERIVVQPGRYARFSPIGARITLTHEVTHLAAAAATTGTTPRWVVEGLAEYVANLHTGQPVRMAAAELADRVRAHGAPLALPDDADFDSPATSASAYEQAWLACRLIAQRVGPAGLVRFYRLAGRQELDPTATALRAVLHESTAGFVAQWRAAVRTQLG